MRIKRRHIFIAAVIVVVILLVQSSWRGSTEGLNSPQDRPPDNVAFEARQTAKLLSVPVQDFPAPQGLGGFDELPTSVRAFTFYSEATASIRATTASLFR